MSEESDEFSDAHSSNFMTNDEENDTRSSHLFITNNASDVFSIEGPGGSVTGTESETEDDDDFFDVIELQQNENLTEFERETTEKEQNLHEDALPQSTGLISRRKQKGLTILEFLNENDEPDENGNDTSNDVDDRADENRRETIYEFLASDTEEDEEEGKSVDEESSLSRLQRELKKEEAEDSQKRRTIFNFPSNEQISSFPRRRESLSKRANPLASFFVDSSGGGASDSDSMISELTETLTTRTDISETRLSRTPSNVLHQSDYLKLAKRYKPVPVKVKSKQKGEFSSLLLIQELNRSHRAGVESPTDVTSLSKAIFVLKFSPDGHFLAAAGAEGVIKIWSLLKIDAEDPSKTPPHLAAIFDSDPVQILRGHTAEILDCAWSTNNFLLSASMDKTVRLWHHSRPDALGIFEHLDYVTSVAFHPRDPRIFLSGSLDCKLRLWSIQDRTILHWNELPPGNYITAVAFTRSGATAIAGTSRGTALIFDTDRLRYNTQILVRSSRSTSVGKKITSIEVVPGNYDDQDERIVISSNDSRIRMYSLRDKNVLYKYKGHENVSSQIGASLSSEADFVLSGSEDCRVYLWRTDGKFEKKSFFDSFRKDHIKSNESFKAHSNPVTAAIFAPNCLTNLLQSLQLRPINPLQATEGKIIVTADVTGQIKIFENNSKLIEWLK